MKVIITNKVEIKSKKDNKEYVILSYIDPTTGDAEKAIVEKTIFEGYELTDDSYLSKDELQGFASKSPTVDMSFNNRGRLTNIT